MKYLVLAFYDLIYKGNVIITSEINEGEIIYQLRSREDFAEVKFLFFESYKYSERVINNKLILSNLKDQHFIITFETFAFEEYKTSEYPFTQIDSSVIYYDPSRKSYYLKINNTTVIEFPRDLRINFLFTLFGIVRIYNSEPEFNKIEIVSYKLGLIIWTINYKEKIHRFEAINNSIIIVLHKYNLRTDSGYEGETDWHNPEVFVVVIDAETGQEKWRAPGGYHNIDKIRNSILSGGTRVIEYDLDTGVIICEQPVTKEGDNWIESVYYADNEGFYYRDIKGFFGKVRKIDGVVDWEFYLYDESMIKRQIGDFVILGNGKIVLKTGPLSDAYIMCIFEPIENIDFAHIRDGKKVIPKHLEI